MVTVPEAVALGVVQGLTEFLPISSSAHLVLLPWLLRWDTPDNIMAFNVALHLGTLFAVLVYFFFDWLMIIASYIGDLRMKRWKGGVRGSMLPKVLLGTVPAVLAGLVLERHIEEMFYRETDKVWIIGILLALFGLFLLLGELFGRKERGEDAIGYRDALLIGVAQAFAIIPGVSRSGVTILAALLVGLTRPAAARFSFLLGTPVIAGAALLTMGDLHVADLSLPLFIGILTSAVTGILAIKVLLKWVQHRSYGVFVYYRWLLAAVVLVVYYLRSTQG